VSNTNDWNTAIIAEFRANGGKVGGRFEGSTLLLLHTIGAKSGQERVNPLACIRDGDRLLVVGSKAGAPTHPDWYHNLAANPEVTVELGTEQFRARAAVAAEPERTRLFAKIVEERPGFADYQTKTTRVIPVVILTPIK
jgi:deazaflavin-dependent oxidoreductase (nitroreductase family)